MQPRRRHVALMAAALTVFGAPLLPAPTAGAAAGADCGTGRDTPPAILIPSGGTCHGTHDGEVPPWPSAQSDYYDVDVTDADRLQVSFSGSCPYTYHQVSGSFEGWSTSGYVAEGDQRASIAVRSPYYTFDGGTTCASEGRSTNYTVSAVVTPNDRPVIDTFDAPSEVLVGLPYDLQVGASDPDGNLDRIGVATSCCVGGEVAAGDGSADSATVSMTFLESGSVRPYALDAFEAEGTAATQWVTITEDDCGTGGDIATHPLGFASPCRAYLAASLSDTSDTFTVDVGTDVARGRVLVDEVTSGMTTAFTVASPSGATVAVDAQGVFEVTEAGEWAVTVSRTGWMDGAYDIEVLALPAPVPPTLAVSLAPGTTPHVGEFITLSATATDAAGLPVRYEVDWGDGTTRTLPASGFVESGLTQATQHRYWDATPATVTVTAFNTDGLSATWSETVTPRVDWDRCTTGDGADRDAPNHNANWKSAHNASFAARDHLACGGALGHWIPATCGSNKCLHGDNGDLFRIRACSLGSSPCQLGASGVRDSAIGQVEVTVTTSADLPVTVTIGSTSYGTVAAGTTRTFRTGDRIMLSGATNIWLQPVGSATGTYTVDAVVHPSVVVDPPD